MTTETKTYLIVAETDYYGPETRRSVVVGDDGRPQTYPTEAAARDAAEEYDPDYDPSVDCHRLGHNQASRTVGRAAEVVTEDFDAEDWASFESVAPDLWEAAAALERAGVEPDEALARALDEADYVVGPDGRTLCKIL